MCLLRISVFGLVSRDPGERTGAGVSFVVRGVFVEVRPTHNLPVD